MGWHYSDQFGSDKFIGICWDAAAGVEIGGAGGYAYGGNHHAETFSTSVLYNVGGTAQLQFKGIVITGFNPSSTFWAYFTVNIVKVS